MTLNGVMAVILRYFSEFRSSRGALRKSSRSLSHLLMSCCTNGRPTNGRPKSWFVVYLFIIAERLRIRQITVGNSRNQTLQVCR